MGLIHRPFRNSSSGNSRRRAYNRGMTKLAFSTNAFKKNTLEEAIDAIAAVGYLGVEIMADVPHAYPPTMDATARAELLARIERLGLTVSNVNAFTFFALGDTFHPTWIEDEPAKREQRIQHTITCVDLAKSLRATTMSLEPGGPLLGTKLTRETAADRYAEGLRRVLPHAQQNGVTLMIEPEPGHLIESAAEYRQFKQSYFHNEPLVRMNCDVGHLFCVGEDPAEVIRAMPEEIAHVHVEDIGKNRVHQHLTPGKGVIDFRSIFAALRDVGYGGWATVELYPYETTAAGVARLAYEHLAPMLREA